MELQFTITPAHTQIRLAVLLEREMQKHDQQQIQLMGYVERMQDHLLSPLLFALCLGVGALAIYFPERQLTSEKVISMVLFGVVFAPLWWFFSGRLLGYLSTRMTANRTKPRAPLRGLNQRLIETRLRTNLEAAEGDYRLQLDDKGFTMISPKGIKSGLAWGQVVRVKESFDFYFISCAELDRKGKAYLIPRHSDAMDAEQYQQGLKLFLSRVPTPTL
ncbi:MAG: YcxB family protein [Pseudomonas mandelii]